MSMVIYYWKHKFQFSAWEAMILSTEKGQPVHPPLVKLMFSPSFQNYSYCSVQKI